MVSTSQDNTGYNVVNFNLNQKCDTASISMQIEQTEIFVNSTHRNVKLVTLNYLPNSLAYNKMIFPFS